MMVIATPDVLSVFVVVILFAIVPDAVRACKPVMMLLCIATSAPNGIPVLFKPMIVASVNISIFIVLAFKVSLR